VSISFLSRPITTLLVAAAWFAAAVTPSDLGAQEVPAGGTVLLAEANLSASGFYGETGDVATRSIEAVQGQSFSEVAQVATLNPSGNFWSSAMTFSNSLVVNESDVVLLHFFARMIETQDESGTATTTVYVEGPDFAKSVSVRINVSSAWKEYFVPFESVGTYALGQLGFKFGFGATGRAQVIEVGGVAAWTYGQTKTLAEMPRTSFDYSGRASDAPWRAEAAARIDQHRKGNYAVRVQDDEGNPIDGTTVRVRMVKHAFEFGTAMVASRIMDSASADAATYRQKILELFTSGTLENDTKWPAWIGQFGPSFNPAQTVDALKWTQQNDLAMRGHVLVWPSVRNLPTFIGDLVTASDPSVPSRILTHIADVMSTTQGYFNDWDVINEPFDNFDVMDKYGYDLMAEWFKAARSQEASGGRFINDYGILSGGGLNTAKQDAYAATISRIKADGGPITGVGFQGHFSGTPTGITKVGEILERYTTEFPELDMRITEFDITGDDEALKSDYLRDFYTIAFSHPKMLGVQMWGFWEGAHWKDESALYNADWSERPMGRAYRELVHGEWLTNDLGVTGTDGMMTGRGFSGEYVIEDAAGRKLGSLIVSAGNIETLVVTLSGASPNGGRLASLSTRGRVLGGVGKMVAGFVIEGSTTKDVVLRAVGPRLSDFGVPGLLVDPKIAIFRAGESTPFAAADSWDSSMSSVFATLGAFSLGNDKASAAMRTQLAPGAYTVEVSGADDGMGVAIVEVYDPDSGAPVHMVNLSTRGAVGDGTEIMVAGFVIEGSSPQRVLIRGVGPALAGFAVDGVLANPVIKLFRVTSTGPEFMELNTAWNLGENAADIVATTSAVGGFSLQSGGGDAALLVDLAPGAYTVELAGVANSTGIGLIEVYRVP